MANGIRNHRDLTVWQESVQLAVDCYKTTQGFPAPEQRGLAIQMRRAAVSIASNIAEGAARTSSKEFVQYLYIALGSASELDTQIEIARKTGLGSEPDIGALQASVNGISRMLQGLIKSVKRRSTQSPITDH